MRDPRQIIATVIRPVKMTPKFGGPNWFLQMAGPGVLFWLVILVAYIQNYWLPDFLHFDVTSILELCSGFALCLIAFICGLVSLVVFFIYPPGTRPLYNAGALLVHISIFGFIIYLKIFVLGPHDH